MNAFSFRPGQPICKRGIHRVSCSAWYHCEHDSQGDCSVNAVVESFFGSMKTELGDPIFESRSAARAAYCPGNWAKLNLP